MTRDQYGAVRNAAFDCKQAVNYDGKERAEQTVKIDEGAVRVSVFRVNRECYDNLPTPTVRYELNGKRIASKALFALLVQP